VDLVGYLKQGGRGRGWGGGEGGPRAKWTVHQIGHVRDVLWRPNGRGERAQTRKRTPRIVKPRTIGMLPKLHAYTDSVQDTQSVKNGNKRSNWTAVETRHLEKCASLARSGSYNLRVRVDRAIARITIRFSVST